jgi:hypothetical protein
VSDLLAENERLREALEPFTHLDFYAAGWWQNNHRLIPAKTVANLIEWVDAARAALAPPTERDA